MCNADVQVSKIGRKNLNPRSVFARVLPKETKAQTPAASPVIDNSVTQVPDAPIKTVSRRNRLGIRGGGGSGLSVPL